MTDSPTLSGPPSGATALEQAAWRALESVLDPELRRPVTELGMVASVTEQDQGDLAVVVRLTVAGCPLRQTITEDVRGALFPLQGCRSVDVQLDVMTPQQLSLIHI